MARTLLDGLWYFGGNRDRGIGKYLDYYFREVCTIPEEDRFWLVPQDGADWQVNRLLSRYGGQSFELDTRMSGQRQRELLERWLDEKEILAALVSSPFERPRSMLDFTSLFQEKAIGVQAIVFDLLPLQLRDQILNTWPKEDQEMYERRVKRLLRVDQILAISPQTKQAVNTLLDYPAEQISVLPFGLTTKWITIPKEVKAVSRAAEKSTRVLTISGGEWRKNLVGSMEYFARHWKGKPAVFSVICQLGTREVLKLLLHSARLGILPQVRFLGKVSENEKWEQLLQADVFLFLSRAEGLGIPLLEAKKAGVPQIIISQELADEGFGSMLGSYKVAEPPNK